MMPFTKQYCPHYFIRSTDPNLIRPKTAGIYYLFDQILSLRSKAINVSVLFLIESLSFVGEIIKRCFGIQPIVSSLLDGIADEFTTRVVV
jgi:hypothetical protein